MEPAEIIFSFWVLLKSTGEEQGNIKYLAI